MNADPLLIRAQQVQGLQVRLAELAMQVPMPPETAPQRHHIGYQEFGLSFHHALSIVSLVKQHGPNLTASAFALARPMLETLQRRWWFTTCATDAQAAAFIAEDNFPIRQVVEIARAIEAVPPFAGTGYFTRLNQEEWNAYHSFTHGGLFALDAYGNRPNLVPDYDASKVLAVLDNAQRMSGVAAIGMAWIGLIYEPERTAQLYQAIKALGPRLGR